MHIQGALLAQLLGLKQHARNTSTCLKAIKMSGDAGH